MTFCRRGASHRLRFDLKLKGLVIQPVVVNLRTEAHLQATLKAINPQGLVPSLNTGEEVLIQSPDSIEGLEEAHPTPALLPTYAKARAHLRALATTVGCDIHLVNKCRILEYLRHQFGADNEVINA